MIWNAGIVRYEAKLKSMNANIYLLDVRSLCFIAPTIVRYVESHSDQSECNFEAPTPVGDNAQNKNEPPHMTGIGTRN